MRQRGRKSAASLEVHLPDPSLIEAVSRPDAPYELTDEESAEWWSIVDRMPADWFGRESHPLLVQFCRHVVTARRVAQLVAKAEQAKRLNVEYFDLLLRMQERESRCIASLAGKMRLSQSSVTRPETTHKPAWTDSPWLFEAKSK